MEPERLAELMAACSNAGRWGADDELGTLNLITPEVRRRATALVQEGVSVGFGSDLDLEATPFSDALVSHRAYADPASPLAVADDVTLHVHGWSTHLDALGHIATDGVGYDGWVRSDVFDESGLRVGAITAMRDGILTRGLLLDVASAAGREWLPGDHEVSADELDQAEAVAGVRVEPGDALFLRVGLRARLAAEPTAPIGLRAGLGIDAVLWLRQRDVALFGGDCVERLPGDDASLPLPLHQLGIGCMGLALLDWPDIERLAEACRRFGRHDFLLTVAPLPIVRGTGSPVNPVATF